LSANPYGKWLLITKDLRIGKTQTSTGEVANLGSFFHRLSNNPKTLVAAIYAERTSLRCPASLGRKPGLCGSPDMGIEQPARSDQYPVRASGKNKFSNAGLPTVVSGSTAD
jgi:hypothetical protein